MEGAILWEGETAFGYYQVVDTLYDGRPARVLYSGDRQAAQSGVAQDDEPDLLFDYNQRMFELANGLVPNELLLIGGAVGTLATALLRTFPKLRVDMVEPDEALVGLGHRYFDLPASDRLRVFHTDGRTFLREHAGRYDMVVVDAFVHAVIPTDLQTVEAFRAYAAHLRPEGVLAMNIISGYHGRSARVLAQLYAAALHGFDTLDVFLAGHGYSLWLPQNFVLTAQKGSGRPLQDYVRYEAVKPPEVHPGLALRD